MEPMTLGSPTTQHSPVNTSGVLPGFLLGEPQHPRPNTFSPTKKTLSFGHQSPGNIYTSPTHQDPMTPHNRSPFNQSGVTGGYHQQQQQQQTKLFKYHPQSQDSSISAPPTVGLFDTLREERNQGTPVKSQTNQVTSPFQQQFGGNASANESYLNASGFNYSRVMSPIQNYSNLNETIGNNTSTKPTLNTFWITIFGFQPSSVATILSHFAQCGTIVDKVFAPQNGNWIHIRFSSRIECDKALNFNGKIIANTLMIGVVPCTDQTLIDADQNENRENISKMRPLSRVTYDTAKSPTTVEPHVFAPKLNNGIVSKAMDLFFGW